MKREVPLVIFFQVKDPKLKLLKLVQTVQSHFSKKEKIIIFAEDLKALNFIDELLWKHPMDSFLPHEIVEKESKEYIALTKDKINWNQATVAFNLCQTSLLLKEISTIYEFEDISSPSKQTLSQQRFESYKNAPYLIELHV